MNSLNGNESILAIGHAYDFCGCGDSYYHIVSHHSSCRSASVLEPSNKFSFIPLYLGRTNVNTNPKTKPK